ncbi:Nucleoside-diphosphate-sugar epimerase [Acidisarcina polymorpha]|uniref:Nucleoside-diphosphate-sugar epimerase n=1 Tax=Acidisarcina polymorpha TaxID=2211140 RepID=A0A2Z5FXD5_9BACT|nr:SDR family oxidoreductase [Acidisarcina polymorpha]AXC11543.1 Nucleoside-diphosphate-sugar epimerase [Acidisarcina polymorpha]
MNRTALIAGATGITGENLAAHLLAKGWGVYGLARRPRPLPGLRPVIADLQDADSVRDALSALDVSHLFICTWARQETEIENVRVNGAMVENLLAALAPAKSLAHAALVTGTKHYLGPFESYGQSTAETPFREDAPRLPGLNFYYTQEDILYAAAQRHGFTWSVHRPHTVIGYALGNAMNMGVTLAVYATICRHTGEPFVFPGSQFQWNALTDVTDARILAHHLEWASTTPAVANQAFNIVNGEIFRWRWLWPQLAEWFGVRAVGPGQVPAPLQGVMRDAGRIWKEIAGQHGLVEEEVEKLASWWHTDADLGREVECVNDMTKSRKAGFEEYQETYLSFVDVFTRLREGRIIPA